MNNFEYNAASQVELIEGFRLTLENSLRLFRSAEDISMRKYYSVATSLLILSAEEAIKAIALAPRIMDRNIEVDYKVKEYFSAHAPKQKAIRLNSDLFHKAYNRLIEIVAEESKNLAFINHDDTFIKNFHRKIDILKNKLVSNKDIDSADIINWWEKNRNLKDIGFYVDFSAGKWQSPTYIIDESKYISSFEKAAEV